MDKLGGRLREPEWSRTPQKDLLSKLTKVYENWQRGTAKELAGAPYTDLANVQLFFHVCPLTIRVGAVADSLTCLWIPSPNLCFLTPQF